MIALDRTRFFDGWRRTFGALTQAQVVSIEALLAALESDAHVTDVRWAAYMLATAYHETAATMAPIDEFGSDEYFNRRYGPHTSVGRNLGNTEKNDGARFHGRGLVQLTGRRNHRVMSQRLFDSYGQTVDLVANPERAKDTLTAYRIMSVGMRDGAFTGRALKHYINGAKCDYRNARRIINGTDRAALIAGHADKFERILRGASTIAHPEPTTPSPAPLTAKAAIASGTVGVGLLATASTWLSDNGWIVAVIAGLLLVGILGAALWFAMRWLDDRRGK